MTCCPAFVTCSRCGQHHQGPSTRSPPTLASQGPLTAVREEMRSGPEPSVAVAPDFLALQTQPGLALLRQTQRASHTSEPLPSLRHRREGTAGPHQVPGASEAQPRKVDGTRGSAWQAWVVQELLQLGREDGGGEPGCVLPMSTLCSVKGQWFHVCRG